MALDATPLDETSVAEANYAFVDAVVSAAEAIQRVSLYGVAVRWWARNENTNRRRAQVAPIYTLSWVVLEGAILFSSRWWATSVALTLTAAAIAAYRFLDLIAFYVCLILSRRRDRSTVAGFERSLTLLAFNIVELSLISGIWFRAAGMTGATGAWFSGFLLTTLLSAPSKAPHLSSIRGTEIDLATVATVCGSLVLLVGGAALLLGLIGQKFREAVAANHRSG